MSRLEEDFYSGDAVRLAQLLPGMDIVMNSPVAGLSRYMITETEAYLGSEDKACHASKGRTKRNEIMFERGGFLYVYFVYGMHWMMNIVTGEKDNPQAVLIRSVEPFTGPGRVTKGMGINGTFNGADLTSSERIWVEDNGCKPSITACPRVGINYAGEPWISMPWRFMITDKIKRI
jgi:DNA-3-methyladenine glycosylase